MQFFKHENTFTIIRTTGNKHNLLSITLADGYIKPEFKELLLHGSENRLDEELLVLQVLSGLEEVNSILNTKYYLSTVRYVASDSQPIAIYNFLIQELISRIHHHGEFSEQYVR